MHGASSNWSHHVLEDQDGTCRLEITDEDGVVFPIARQVTRAQAERLVQRIADESRTSRTPIKVVIRDPYFMAATVITLKRQGRAPG
jgi:flagellar motor protein MotB